MPYQESQENWKKFNELLAHFANLKNEQNSRLINRYIEQNLIIINDMLLTSLENLKKLQEAKTPEEIICIQAKFTNEINNKAVLSAQRYLNSSLLNIADYNEWLKAHCDLATD